MSERAFILVMAAAEDNGAGGFNPVVVLRFGALSMTLTFDQTDGLIEALQRARADAPARALLAAEAATDLAAMPVGGQA